jgi:hypothetical protein
MPQNERYFIGPGLRDKLRDVITRVGGMPDTSSGATIPTRLQTMGGPAGASIKAVTFTGSWFLDSEKMVTFHGVTSTPNTVMATNQLFTIGDACNTQFGYIGKVPSAGSSYPANSWHLLNVQHTETAVMVNVTLTTASLDFTRRLMWVPYPGETSTLSLQLTTSTACS